ncbi:hypothetical protein [Deinococcus aestuarii]|uniref:hypothetical protein n=1 Tax=Deinococcus aestuarii TaxID=2774531 RepID=UPI001C0C5501|nr:hypothetical protein [Deinococcus aestuarii]
MTLAEQLAQARIDAASLDGDTGKLEANLAQQTAELERLRREARAERATFADVVKQQTRWDAARGMLEQHLQDVANARALVEELEAAHRHADTVALARGARAEVARLEAEHSALADEVERYLADVLPRLEGLTGEHAAAQRRLALALRDGAVSLGEFTTQQAADVLAQTRAAPVGEVRRQVMAAVEAFAGEVDAQDARLLVSLARRVPSAGPELLTLSAWPTLARMGG